MCLGRIECLVLKDPIGLVAIDAYPDRTAAGVSV